MCVCVRAHALPGSKVAQACGDVLAVVVNLLRVERALAVQAMQRLFELHQLSLAPLPVQTLVTDILQGRKVCEQDTQTAHKNEKKGHHLQLHINTLMQKKFKPLKGNGSVFVYLGNEL